MHLSGVTAARAAALVGGGELPGPKPEHFRGLQRLAERLGDRFLGGVVLGPADQGARFGGNPVGLPIAFLWEL